MDSHYVHFTFGILCLLTVNKPFLYMQQFTNDAAFQGFARFIVGVFTVLYILWAVIAAD